MPTGVAVLTLILALATTAMLGRRPAKQGGGPRLVVLIVIDQMRTDYLERFGQFTERGLRRLLTEGAVFERAAYPYLSTVTCAGHATIATGSFPATHGIVANEWWSRADGRRIVCTDNATVASVPYGSEPEKIGHGPNRLKTPTLGDRLRRQDRESRVVSVAIKPRSAIMLGGHSGTAVTWYADAARGWATSTAYSPTPVPAVRAALAANPIARDRTQVWNQLKPETFTGRDDVPGERPKRGWTKTFPHPLAGAESTPEAQFYELWKCSPFADDYVTALATAQLRDFQLGRRGVVDLLGVSYSALDCVGHDFGPDSAEVHDVVLQLDRTLGVLFDALDTAVGRDQYVVGLSADHGVSPIPEQHRAAGADAGRVLAPEVRKIAEAAMTAAHGPGPHVASLIPPSVYFTEVTRALVAKDPDVAAPAIEAIASIEGVLRVLPTRGLESRRRTGDRIVRAAALSYHPEESGDLMYVPRANWVNGESSAASHGTPHEYDQHVPVILLGAGIKPGRYRQQATPADIAPTLAAVIKLPLPADGKVLKAALR